MRSVIDELPYLTCRLECIAADGSSSLGTGFFYSMNHPRGGTEICIGTNKHVVEGADRVVLHITRRTEDGKPQKGSFHIWVMTEISKAWLGHPDPEVDLAMFSISEVLNLMEGKGFPPFFRTLSSEHIPTENQINEMLAVEEINMIGYPTGLWDSKNNLPIIRKGITATPYLNDYMDRPEFVIDAACFPGSSGSPVLIVDKVRQNQSPGGYYELSRLYFLGVLWGGPQYTAEGKIEARTVPTNHVPISMTLIPINLGLCVKARAVLELEALIKEKISGR